MNCCAAISSGSSRETSAARTVNGGPRPATLVRRWRKTAGEFAKWIVPGGILVLVPKCPACIVAYFAIAGGVGISLSIAIYLRRGLVILCVGSLVYFAVRRGRRFVRGGLHHTDESLTVPLSSKMLSMARRGTISSKLLKAIAK